ncbi:BMP family ABC transporter substrate-binding protein [Desulfobacula sp.]|uniref:BMP family ABC transporter substrate-binding protein n=1 Tax=Desulfobacula sp. TaxID=2593537 RepID=UPI0025C49E16|nr:BMP family ABC transporter substrate-binding protein [Desulfobacula sp.]MBC2705088.1 BMP family ABC transporter substrate-binding protein [Desulfobacula sp.]
MKKWMILVLMCSIFLIGFSTTAFADDKKLKAGFIYVGPVGDYGFSHAHDMGRQYAEKKFPWLETIFVESVADADCARIIDRLVQQQKCDVVFTTSFGFMDETIKAGTRYPDKLFMHCSGFKRSDNVGTYFGDLYQMYYLNGIMAGALTKTNKIGYVAAFPIPELVRHIDAYALGIKAANPAAKLNVKWIYAWYGPDKAKEAAEALIAEGCDALAFTEDTPAVIEVGQRHSEKGKQIYTFSHYSPMQPYGVDSVVSGQLMNWGGMYTKILGDIYNKTWTNEDLWWLAKEKAAILGGSPTDIINPKFVGALKKAMLDTKEFGKISAYDLVVKRYAQMKQGVDVFEPFTGPISDNKGTLKIKAGETASKGDLLSIMYYVDNVEGDVPQ